MMRCVMTIALLALTWAIGCDQKPPASPPAPAAAPASGPAAAPIPPGAADRRVRLSPVPVSVVAPSSWQIDSAGNMNFLRGPTPHGEATILLTRKNAIPQYTTGPSTRPENWVALEVEGAHQKRQADPTHFPLVRDRKLGPATVLEKQIVEPRSASGASTTAPAAWYRWTITLYVPHNGDIRPYELSFLGLTVDQFQQDKDFLTRIMDTLQYDPPADPN